MIVKGNFQKIIMDVVSRLMPSGYVDALLILGRMPDSQGVLDTHWVRQDRSMASVHIAEKNVIKVMNLVEIEYDPQRPVVEVIQAGDHPASAAILRQTIAG